MTMQPQPDFNRIKDTRYGKVLYNVNDMYVGRSFELYAEFSEGEVELFKQIIRPGDIVLDVGANIGAHTLFMSSAVGDNGAVLAFEPQRLVFQTLCANMALNNRLNAWCYQKAAGESAGMIQVPVLDPRQIQNFGGLGLENVLQGEPVEVIRLDSLPLPACRMIKVDVEGMEATVLRGAAGLLEKFKPVLYVENDRPEHREALVRLVDSLGYDMYWHTPPLYNPDNFAKNTENVFENIVSINMLCVHKSSGSNIAGMPKVEVPKA